MKTENQICSLESAKKLKELGVEQKSLWYWVKTDLDVDTDKFQLVINSKGYVHYGINVKVPDYGYGADGSYGWRSIEKEYSAFTVAELGEMLPEKLNNEWLTCQKVGGYWEAGYKGEGDTWIEKEDKIEAEARAKMLIYLLENKLIEKGEK